MAWIQSSAQSKFVVEGHVINKKTGEPIGYSNVGIPGKYIGVAANKKGVFKLKLPAGTESDTLQISAIGFESQRVIVSEFKQRAGRTVSLQPKTYQFNSITVTDKKDVKTEWIGNEKIGFFKRLFGVSRSYGEEGFGKNLGATYAFKVEWDKSLPLRILSTRIYRGRNYNEWPVKLRCRIQSVDPETGWPGKDLMHQNIQSSPKKIGWISCNFSDEQIYIDKEDFFIVFEWLKETTGNGTPVYEYHKSLESEVYVRRQALGRWEKIPYNLRYGVKVEY